MVGDFGLFLLLINAAFFYGTFYSEIAVKIDGGRVEGGFLFTASRFMHWGYFCLSRNRARRFGVGEVLRIYLGGLGLS